MADILIRDLTEETVNDPTYYVVIDDATFVEAKKMTVDNFLEPEETQRVADDEEIRDSCGLETDYTFQPDESSNYVKTSDFVAAGIAANLKNAISLLDTQIYSIENQVFLEAYITMTKAQLEASFSVGGTVISAPAAGYMINLKSIIGKNNKITTAWVATGTDTLDFVCNGIVLGFLSHNFLESAVIVRERGVVNEGDGFNLTPASQLTWKTTSADLTTGTESISVRILFELVPDTFSSSAPVLSCCNTPVADTFTNADLNGAFQLVINHGLNSEIVMGVVVIDPTGLSAFQNFQLGDGDNLYINKNNFITVEFGGAIAAGTWTYYFVVTT